ncbi:MAG: hypothetical protein NMK33_00495 [Candidatus Cardinium sp.]|uniref:hypothetical protein n=1 Tax=Cardinium endosymbiont of Dermatophagoides farinae TaxID=2597823 RepID=UPI00118253B2|nr:hypothetical protein [Cardinium endosymbiont of Dermatophagoides farinae]TSJ81009.1 hypothetical protein FPG78_03175 [Cardinium endosymbiont of Dermatophagoides farinae]UWW97035.1 MAG: hypothetical protein NMK33_00495 [Candidatus Cardinium sp.]
MQLGRPTNLDNKDDQEKIVKSFRQQLVDMVPHYLHPNNNLIASLKPFARLYSFYEVIKELLDKYIYDNWIVHLLIDAAHKYQ